LEFFIILALQLHNKESSILIYVSMSNDLLKW